MELSLQVKKLLQKGVRIYNPLSVDIGDEVHIDRISGGCTLHCGTRIRGAQTFMAEGASIGSEGPATIEDCLVGPDVQLNGGYYQKAVFLKGATCGSGSHLREGTLLEEYASIAHTVGLKQTILFPFVTLGSLINFCDCLMAGGTDRHNHSEVGSAYIHFNFTANQDKATPSLIGDVPRGVMLNQAPIFLGGQGGLVGPSRVAYGTVLAAGSIFRGDQLAESRIVFAGTSGKGSLPFKPGVIRNFKRVLFNNFNYISNLIALGHWYRCVRAQFIGIEFPQPLFDGVVGTIRNAIQERLKQLDRLVEKIASYENTNQQQQYFCHQWPKIKSILEKENDFPGAPDLQRSFLEHLDDTLAHGERSYLAVIKRLTPSHAAVGSQWLESIVQSVILDLNQCLPMIGEAANSN